MKTMRDLVTAFCARISQNPLLVQGAGGNVSWKQDDTLWVKASGTCLADAGKRDIFVPVDFFHLKGELQNNYFTATPKVFGTSAMRPSLETLLHALMPHRVVVHLHPVEILAYLVRARGIDDIATVIGHSLRWVATDYFKPGEELAAAVSAELKKNPAADVVFLQNHGVVIGGSDIAEVEHILLQLTNQLATPALPPKPTSHTPPIIAGYNAVDDQEIQQLALNDTLFESVKSSWALYPDHVVFLGARAICFNSPAEVTPAHELIFVRGQGVYTGTHFTQTKLAQLRCFYDVQARQPEHAKLQTLDEKHIAALLNWDAEKYRMEISRHSGN